MPTAARRRSARVVSSGGEDVVLSGATASSTAISGGLVVVASGGTLSNAEFNSATSGELELASSAGFSGAISGYGGSDKIDLLFVPFGSGTTVGVSEANGRTSGTLTVASGTIAAHLTLIGDYVTSQFHIASDGQGGTLVTDPPVTGGGPAFSQFDFTDLDSTGSVTTAGARSAAAASADAPRISGSFAGDGSTFLLFTDDLPQSVLAPPSH
jgi:autotransporter passenger strand-loop-strand repeat protein